MTFLRIEYGNDNVVIKETSYVAIVVIQVQDNCYVVVVVELIKSDKILDIVRGIPNNISCWI